MPNFDFHTNLSPIEFERLVRDVLEIREAPLKFRSFKPGPDGGVDLRCTTSHTKIIGQVKLYKNDYRQLKRALLNELPKVKRQKPSRYILATSISLSANDISDILNLFEEYIQSEEDILDREQLNKYLGTAPYTQLLRTYSKLLVPDLNILEIYLEDVLYRDIQNSVRQELRKIDLNRQFFVQTKTFDQAVSLLEKNKALILSGNPGVGKTMLAHMAVNFILLTHPRGIEFVNCRCIEDIQRTFKPARKQVFLWDDFWGQKFNEVPGTTTSSYQRQFIGILKDFQHYDDHYLLITSREYIIQDVLSTHGMELEHLVSLSRFSLKIDAYSEEDRLRIFLNHLYFSKFEKEYIPDLRYSARELESILNHPNYSPRQVEFFFKFVFNRDPYTHDGLEHQIMLDSFREYLNAPRRFWKELFDSQSDTAKLLLLILLISGDPMHKDDMKLSFMSFQKSVRTTLNLQIEPLHFDSTLQKLEELFIRTEKPATYLNDVWIHFQSPGIKDFALEYLRERIDQFAEVVIEGASFFNQLNFVFTTSRVDKQIFDDESEYPIFSQKIWFNERMQAFLKMKIMSEFDRLSFSGRGQGIFNEECNRTHSPEAVKYWKLRQFHRMFDIHKEDNSDVRKFIIKEVLEDLNDFETNKSTNWHRMLSYEAMPEFPGIVELIKPYNLFDGKRVVSAYHSNISFMEDFFWFMEFQKIFPSEYNQYLTENITTIRAEIKSKLIDDIDQLICDKMYFKLDDLKDSFIPAVFKHCGVRMTNKLRQAIRETSEGYIDLTQKKRIKKRQRKIKEKEPTRGVTRNESPKFKRYDTILKEYIGNEKDFDANRYLNRFYKRRKSQLEAILNLKRSAQQLFAPFFNDERSLLQILSYFERNGFPDGAISIAAELSIVDHFIGQELSFIGTEIEVEEKSLLQFFNELAHALYYKESKTCTESTLLDLAERYLGKLIDPIVLQPIVRRTGTWFEFLNSAILDFFMAKYVSNEPVDDFFIEQLETLAEINYGQSDTIMQLIERNNRKRFYQLFLEPNIAKFLWAVKGDTTREVLQNYVRFFGIEFELQWLKTKKKLETGESGSAEMLTEFSIQYLLPDINLITLDIFFCKDYYHNVYRTSHSKKRNQSHILYTQVTNSIKPQNKRPYFNPDKEQLVFPITLSEFIEDDLNYLAIQESGLEEYVISNIKAISECYKQHFLQYEELLD